MAELVYVEGLGQGAEYIHLGDGVKISEDALEVSIFNTVSELRKNGEVYLELMY